MSSSLKSFPEVATAGGEPQPLQAGGPQLTVSHQPQGDSVTLILDGEIDLNSGPQFECELHEAERSMPRRIVLDFEAITFVDSTVVPLLIAAQQRAERGGHQLVLTNVPALAQRLFWLTRVRPRLTIE